MAMDTSRMDPLRVEDHLFERVLGESTRTVEDAVLAHELVGEASLRAVVERLADLLGIGTGETLELLGVSRTKLSRNPTMSVDLLDQAGSILKTFARVASLRGPEAATRWFSRPNVHTGNQPPLGLLATRLGRERLHDYVTALEDGAFL